MTGDVRRTCSVFYVRLALLAALAAIAGCAARPPAEFPFHWDEPVAAAGARAPVELPSGELLAVRSVVDAARVTLVVAASRDAGRPWSDVGAITSDARGTDLGDCHLTRLTDGRVLCSYRRNHLRRDKPRYAIEVAESADGGRTWRPHSVVAESQPDTGRTPSRGLWSSFILQKRDGTLQCYYDDEETPFRAGFPRHQWLTMRRWDDARREWVDPVTVSRAHDAAHLSRDGMPSVVELGRSGRPGRLLAVFESVQVRRPHANVVRFVTSDDGGRTWSWSRRERGVVYAPPRDGDYMALAPWVVRLRDGTLLCVFCTDEDRDRPDVSGTPPARMNLDIKYVTSHDDGRTWSRPARLVYGGSHRNYLPGAIQLSAAGAERDAVVVQLLDYGRRYVLLRGRPAVTPPPSRGADQIPPRTPSSAGPG